MNNIIYWAGIGSRETPSDIKTIMTLTSMYLFPKGLILRSGGARGADLAFGKGCPISHKRIYGANSATPLSMDHAERYHPNWSRCSPYARKLHARNSLIVLGDNLDTPVSFCICWTRNAQVIGGTGQAIRICNDMGIPVFNLGDPHLLDLANKWIDVGNKKKEDMDPFYIDICKFTSELVHD